MTAEAGALTFADGMLGRCRGQVCLLREAGQRNARSRATDLGLRRSLLQGVAHSIGHVVSSNAATICLG